MPLGVAACVLIVRAKRTRCFHRVDIRGSEVNHIFRGGSLNKRVRVTKYTAQKNRCEYPFRARRSRVFTTADQDPRNETSRNRWRFRSTNHDKPTYHKPNQKQTSAAALNNTESPVGVPRARAGRCANGPDPCCLYGFCFVLVCILLPTPPGMDTRSTYTLG